MATPTDFAKAFLTASRLPVTENNVRAVIAWQSAEGGHWHNSLTFNPLNTTWAMDGNKVPALRAYSSWSVGILATVKTLLTNHPTIAASLRADKPAAQTLLAIANEPPGQRWGTDNIKPSTIPGFLAPSNVTTYGATADPANTVLSSVEDLSAAGAIPSKDSLLALYNDVHDAAATVAKVGTHPPANLSTWGDQPAWPDVAEAFSELLKALGGIYVSGKNRGEAQAMLDGKPPPDLADRAKRVLEWVKEYDKQQGPSAPTLADLPDPFGPGVPTIRMPNDLPDPFATLSPQARDRALIAWRDRGGPDARPGFAPRDDSGPPVFPGANPFGIPIGRPSRFPGLDGPPIPGLGRPGDNPFIAPGPKPLSPFRGPNPQPGPNRGPTQRPTPGPNPPQQKRTGGSGGSGGTGAGNPPAERSTDPKGASLEARGDPKAATETKTVTPAPAIDAKAPTTGPNPPASTSTDEKEKKEKEEKEGKKDSGDAGASKKKGKHDYGGGSMPNPEDAGGGGEGPSRAPNPENTGSALRVPTSLRFAAFPNPESHSSGGFGGGDDDDAGLGSIGGRVFDPRLFRFRVPGALGDMPSENQNPNPEDQGRGGGGGPRAYGSSSQSSLAGPRSYDAYPDPESTGAGGPKGRYNERPNPEDTAGPRGPNARNRSAIGPWSASKNRMI